MSITQDLYTLLLNKVVLKFKFRRPTPQPWWWPVGDGSGLNCWFNLNQNFKQDLENIFPKKYQKAITTRLTDSFIKTSNIPTKTPLYEGFKGYWGHEKTSSGKRIIILFDQPMSSKYPGIETDCLMTILDALNLKGIHVTDFLKLRKIKNQTISKQQLDYWTEVLLEELAILSEDNSVELCIFVANTQASKWIEEQELENRISTQGVSATIFHTPITLSKENLDEAIENWETIIQEIYSPSVENSQEINDRKQEEHTELNSYSSLLNPPTQGITESLPKYYIRFWSWFMKTKGQRNLAWQIGGKSKNWIKLYHPNPQKRIQMNIGFSGETNVKSIKVEIYVTDKNDKLWIDFLRFLQSRPALFETLYKNPKNHQHTNKNASNEIQRGYNPLPIGTYAIRPSPLPAFERSIEPIMYRGKPSLPRPKTGYYGQINQITKVQKRAISFGHDSGDRRVVTWHEDVFKLDESADVLKAAKWMRETAKIFYAVLRNY